eukprot:6179713-Pleurochrysis_carterae.AAC.1
MELADAPIYQEVRKRGEKVIRDMHNPPEGGDKCEGAVARGVLHDEEASDKEIDIERQEGRREVEKFVQGVRNAEIARGPANGRRMRHATAEGNKPPFWTYLK